MPRTRYFLVSTLLLLCLCSACASTQGRAALGLSPVSSHTSMTEAEAIATLEALLSEAGNEHYDVQVSRSVVRFSTEASSTSRQGDAQVTTHGVASFCIHPAEIVGTEYFAWAWDYNVRIFVGSDDGICCWRTWGVTLSEYEPTGNDYNAVVLSFATERSAYLAEDALLALRDYARGSITTPSGSSSPSTYQQAPPEAECRMNSDCDVGNYCSDGMCTADCREDRDCSSGETCNTANGRCE